MTPPNKRLKLAGGDRLNGSGVFCALAGADCRPLLLRRRAGRPQLKRDPLGRERTTVRHLPPILLASWLAIAGCSRSQTVVLANQTTLRPSTPVVLRATDPLRVVGSVNELCLRPLPPDSLNFRTRHWESGIRRSDGAVITVGAALLRADSSTDTLSSSDGFSMAPGDDCLAVRQTIHDSLHPPFVAVRLTASDSLTVAEVTWRSWTAW